MKRTSLKKPANTPPVIVAIPNTVAEKMHAICALADTVKALAVALNSVNVDVTISNCNIQNAKTGIQLK